MAELTMTHAPVSVEQLLSMRCMSIKATLSSLQVVLTCKMTANNGELITGGTDRE